MSVNETEEEKLAYICWRYDPWLMTYPLNEYTVVDYFKNSQFYDPSCNNQLIQTQKFDEAKLKTMVGVEYELDTTASAADKMCYIIKKQYRSSPTDTSLSALYFVVGFGPLKGTVYPMPTMQSVLAYNAVSAVQYVDSVFQELSSHVKIDHRGYSFTYPPAEVDKRVDTTVDKESSKVVDEILKEFIEKR